MKAILGKKIEMSQVYGADGKMVPVTLVDVSDCFVTNVIKEDSSNASKVQLGVGEKVKKNWSEKGNEVKGKFFKKYKEFAVESIDEIKKGDQVVADVFAVGDDVRLHGISKGKGFQGVVKKYNFGGDLATHGRAHSLRKGGSIASKRLSKVARGKKMPGRMGGKRVSVFGSAVAYVNKEEGLIGIKGSVPGRRGSYVEIVAA